MQFHIESVGEGPAILFIHAGVADSRMWRDQMSTDGYRCIAFDQRGFGKTPWEGGAYSDREDALAVLDEMGVESAVIVGCSMGGGTALQLAIDHPDRVDALVLVGAFPSGWVPEGGWEENPLEEEADEATESGDFDRVVEIDRQMWLVGYGREADDIDPRLHELFVEMDRIPVKTAAERWEDQVGFGKKLNDHLADIVAPTLIIVGAHDEKLLLDAAHYLAEQLSEREAVVIDGAAHLPSLERPDVFNATLRGFLGTL